MALAKERGTAFDSRDWSLYWLAQARLGQGGRQRALELVEEGIGLSSEMPPAGAFGNLMLARVLLSGGDPSDHDRVEEALGAAVEGAYAAAVPLVHVEEAELARQLGDAARRARSLGEAHRLFEEIGATGRAERLAVELEALPG